MHTYEELKQRLRNNPHTWLITGAAGFIGSNLLETLLKLDQRVIGLDNFSTGHKHNLALVKEAVSAAQWKSFQLIEGDICSLETCHEACQSAHYVLHQAALGSVPRSIEDPIATHNNNISGFLNILVAARDAGVLRLVYAASSATYGDHPASPKVESQIGRPLSPYAVTKYVNELYAEIFSRCYGMHSIGLRYFNVFGPRQDPQGAYAAVIPKWISGMLHEETIFINGDGETARDFCYVDNAVQANILAALNENTASSEVFNVALQEQASLNELFSKIRRLLSARFPQIAECDPEFREFRSGDVRYSLADISKARELLHYHPTVRLDEGLQRTVDWYIERTPEALAKKPVKRTAPKAAQMSVDTSFSV